MTTVNAKSLVQAFYGKPAERSYFDSCSDGGREALMEAQRFPEDFDGILAGAPANYWTHLMTSAVAGAQALYSNPAAYFSDIKLPAIHAAVLAACDAADGVKDGVINDPPRCHFDPAVLLCKGRETRTCLTAPQIAALKALYQGAKDSHGRQIFPGLVPGAEEGPGRMGSLDCRASPRPKLDARIRRKLFPLHGIRRSGLDAPRRQHQQPPCKPLMKKPRTH